MKNLGMVNFRHLYQFWVVAREGSLVGASRRLGLSHSTISVQLQMLEQALGGKLMLRRPRGAERLKDRQGDRMIAADRERRHPGRRLAAAGPPQAPPRRRQHASSCLSRACREHAPAQRTDPAQGRVWVNVDAMVRTGSRSGSTREWECPTAKAAGIAWSFLRVRLKDRGGDHQPWPTGWR